MVDLKQRVELQVGRGVVVPTAPNVLQSARRKSIDEATAVDLSVYDAISSNYVRDVT